jgi:Mg-chelatase subunit ChlD
VTQRAAAPLKSITIAAGLFCAACVLAGIARPASSEPAAPTETGTAVASTPTPQATFTPTPAPLCAVSHDRLVDPLTPKTNQEITLTLAMAAECDPNRRPLNLVLVVEATERMGDVQVEKLTQALRDAVEDLDIASRDHLRIGVVTIGGGSAQVRSFLTNDESRILNALPDRDDAGGDPCVHCGLQEALRVLWNGRGGRSADEVREAIVLATVGIDQSGCDALRVSADNLKAFGALVVTACVGRSCENRCLSEAASHERFAFRSWDWTFVKRRIAELAESSGPSFFPIASVTIEDWLSDGKLSYTRGGEPSEGMGNRLVWSFAPWPSEGITRTYHALAITCGRFRASQAGPNATINFNGTFWSHLDPLHVQFANPVLDVPCAEPATATPTPTRPATASPTATATATATGEATRYRPRSEVYLPVALKLSCTTEWAAVDVALAIDVSGSMVQPAIVGRPETRLDVARRIGESILGRLQPGSDLVAIVVYGDEELIQVLAPLADCCGTARLALDRLPYYNGSRMDLAIEVAEAELLGPRGRPAAAKVIVVLTDGDLNRTPYDRLVEVAGRVRGRGSAIHLVAVGEDVAEDPDRLVEIVGAPGRLHLTASVRGLTPEDILGPIPRCRR